GRHAAAQRLARGEGRSAGTGWKRRRGDRAGGNRNRVTDTVGQALSPASVRAKPVRLAGGSACPTSRRNDATDCGVIRFTEHPMKVGIDLGTTNSALAWIDEREAEDRDFPPVHVFETPRLVAAGRTEARRTLPSFL